MDCCWFDVTRGPEQWFIVGDEVEIGPVLSLSLSVLRNTAPEWMELLLLVVRPAKTKKNEACAFGAESQDYVKKNDQRFSLQPGIQSKSYRYVHSCGLQRSRLVPATRNLVASYIFLSQLCTTDRPGWP